MTDELFERELSDEELEQVVGGIGDGNVITASNVANPVVQGNTVNAPISVAPTTNVTAPIALSVQ